MAVGYHIHEFEIPTASDAEVAAGVSSSKVVTPSNLGTASQSAIEDFASAAQGALADGAAQRYVSIAAAEASTIPTAVKRVQTQFRAPSFADMDTLVGGAQYRRESFADLSAVSSLLYFRSTDRFMPDGTTDATNGGYWLLDESVPDPRMAGALADGTDSQLALAAVLSTGKKVVLVPGLTYSYGAQLSPPSGGGFIGGGKLQMLTGAGKFDREDYTGGRATNKVGILIDGKTNVTIEAVIEMQTNAGIRTCNPISVVSSTNVRLDVEVSGFKEADYGLVAWDTNVGGFVKLYAHDCNPDSDTLPVDDFQLTALSIDGDRVASVNSTGLIFDVNVKNVLPIDDAAIAYGYQSDAVNIQSEGYSGIAGRIFADTVGEALDCFGDGNNITVVAHNIYEYGVKLIHGAENNLIFATIDNTRRAAVVFGGSTALQATKPVSHNRVYATARRVGEIDILPNIAAVATDGTSAFYKPEKNYVEITAFGNGSRMAWVVAEDSGSNNVFVADGDGWATNFARIAGSAGTGNNRSVIRRTRRSRVRASVGTATTTTHGSTVPYDTEALDTNGEFDPTTRIFTATSPCRINILAQLRNGGLNSLATFGLIVVKNSTDVARFEAANYAASSQAIFTRVSATMDLDAGDAVRIGFVSSQAGSISITNLPEYSFLEIEEV